MRRTTSDLTQQEIADLGALIAKRLALLEREIKLAYRVGDSDHAQVTPESDADDRVADVDNDLTIAALARDTDERASLNAARKRIRDGDYGACSNCGDLIGFARLLATPGAERCLSCQVKFERTHQKPH